MDSIEVIYVEDDEQEAFIMTIGMGRHHVKIIHLSHMTLQILDQIQAAPYDKAAAVIFDSVLGGESGLDLARNLRAKGDTRPIFLITAGENPSPQLLKSNRIEFRRKPVNFEELAADIQRLK
jgi:DNA-binding response OmpR family regulator